MLRLPINADLAYVSLKSAIRILTKKTEKPPCGLVVGPENRIPAEELLHGGDAIALHIISGMPMNTWILFNGSDLLVSEVPC